VAQQLLHAQLGKPRFRFAVMKGEV
jgi:hypothetical protein